MPLNLTAGADDNGRRLDRILRKALPDLPLSAIYRLLRQGGVLVNGEAAGQSQRIKAGDKLSIEHKMASPTPHSPFLTPHSPLPADSILFEGSGLLVLNKPSGIVVHGRGSLEDQVRSYLGPKLKHSLSFRSGPLHRLDKMSSGLIVFSSSLDGARFFSVLMRERRIKKFYLAIVEGVINEACLWEDELLRDRTEEKTFQTFPGALGILGASKKAITRIRPLASNTGSTLILAEIETGRTHQIRAQAAAHSHPLLGDIKYGGRRTEGGFLLHAWRMEFPDGLEFPGGKELPHNLEAPLPERFQKAVESGFPISIDISSARYLSLRQCISEMPSRISK